MIMDLSCSKYSGRRESKKRRPTVLPAHSVVHLARHDHGLELRNVLQVSTPTPRRQKRNSIRSSKDRGQEGRETRIVKNPLSLTVRSTQTVK